MRRRATSDERSMLDRHVCSTENYIIIKLFRYIKEKPLLAAADTWWCGDKVMPYVINFPFALSI